MNSINELFANAELDLNRLAEIEALKKPRSCYFMAITPRSGSTYLCDMLCRTKRFGTPQEVLTPQGIKIRLPTLPARNSEAYLENILRVKQSANGVSGTKASWFQWQQFLASTTHKKTLNRFKYIYVTRRDLAAQAVSLYKATASDIFHSVQSPDESSLIKLNNLEYDYAQIKFWYEHISAQENGWQQYFYEAGIFPLCIYYEDIEVDILMVLKRIASYVGIRPDNVIMPKNPSPYIKISDERNNLWARQFALEHSGIALTIGR